MKSLSHVQLFATPWTGAYQAPPSMEFSRQVYWSGVPLPSPYQTAKKLIMVMEGQRTVWSGGMENHWITMKRRFVTESESEVAQLCPTLCDSMDWSLPGSSVHGIF